MIRTKLSKPDGAAKRHYQKHGLYIMRRTLKKLGSRALDQRTSLAVALKRWREDIVQDLGGQEVISEQTKTVLDIAVNTRLLLGSIDAWLLQQQSLINKKRRCLFPIVAQRQQLANDLVKYMTVIGLKRVAKRVPSLQEYLSGKEARG